MAEFATDGSLPRPLGDGLLRRRATPADTEALAAFNGQIHGDVEAWEPAAMARGGRYVP